MRRLNGAGDSTDWPTALVVCAGGGVCVTGFGFDDNSTDDFTTVRYNADGTCRWF